MNVTVKEIVKIIESIAPSALAQEWDNCGLLLGRAGAPVKKIMTALDLSPQVLRQAVAADVQMLITHHPVIFTPYKTLTDADFQQELLLSCIEHKIAVYSAHTSLDAARGGVNDVLAQALKLEHAEVLLPSDDFAETGLGRVGILPQAVSLAEFAATVKRALRLPHIAVADAGRSVQRVAVCGGAGSDLIACAVALGADTFVSGDFKYHSVQTAVFAGLNIIDATHQAAELPAIAALTDKLALSLTEAGLEAQVWQAKEDLLLEII